MKVYKLLILLYLMVLVSACGGGSSDTPDVGNGKVSPTIVSTPTPTPSIPSNEVVDSSAELVVPEGFDFTENRLVSVDIQLMDAGTYHVSLCANETSDHCMFKGYLQSSRELELVVPIDVRTVSVLVWRLTPSPTKSEQQINLSSNEKVQLFL